MPKQRRTTDDYSAEPRGADYENSIYGTVPEEGDSLTEIAGEPRRQAEEIAERVRSVSHVQNNLRVDLEQAVGRFVSLRGQRHWIK
ncbi:hypothetical protein ASD03_18645 [Ensifer sp. Root127]|jgi:hypothetical protein|nr:hypothetical protein ASD03_18645 [Ensifer sp. Root127]